MVFSAVTFRSSCHRASGNRAARHRHPKARAHAFRSPCVNESIRAPMSLRGRLRALVATSPRRAGLRREAQKDWRRRFRGKDLLAAGGQFLDRGRDSGRLLRRSSPGSGNRRPCSGVQRIPWRVRRREGCATAVKGRSRKSSSRHSLSPPLRCAGDEAHDLL